MFRAAKILGFTVVVTTIQLCHLLGLFVWVKEGTKHVTVLKQEGNWQRVNTEQGI
jgi:hypothetical protein